MKNEPDILFEIGKITTAIEGIKEYLGRIDDTVTQNSTDINDNKVKQSTDNEIVHGRVNALKFGGYVAVVLIGFALTGLTIWATVKFGG